ncbi:MAG: hypothetical protein ACPGSC_13860, partial [Granulosicoccaceae bacterium]
AAERSVQAGISVSVLAVGTQEGAPVPDRNGHAILGNNGRPVIVGLQESALQELASIGNGGYSVLTADESDIKSLKLLGSDLSAESIEDSDRQTERWVDRGPWLLWLLMPWGLWAFSARWF